MFYNILAVSRRVKYCHVEKTIFCSEERKPPEYVELHGLIAETAVSCYCRLPKLMYSIYFVDFTVTRCSLSINRKRYCHLSHLSVCLCVCLCARKVYCGKTADWIRMPFETVTGVGRMMVCECLSVCLLQDGMLSKRLH